jgi:outer membrane immunogenic protein
MRFLFCGLLLAAAASPALAGDFDNSWLRGSSQPIADPPNYEHWSGFYGGGQVGADFHGVSFGDDGNSTLATIRGNDSIISAVSMPSLFPLLKLTTTGPSFGGFAGYNYQIDDVVVGLELNYNQASASATSTQSAFASPGSLANGAAIVAGPTIMTVVGPNLLTTTNSTQYTPTSVTASNSSTAKLLDYGTVRLRGGWAFGNFLPYIAVGMSVSQVDVTQTVSTHYIGTATTTSTTSSVPNPQTTPATNPTTTVNTVSGPVNYTDTITRTSNGKYGFGFSGAVGVDYALTQHIFLRGEVEYVQLGTPGIATMNTASARVGAGLKF